MSAQFTVHSDRNMDILNLTQGFPDITECHFFKLNIDYESHNSSKGNAGTSMVLMCSPAIGFHNSIILSL